MKGLHSYQCGSEGKKRLLRATSACRDKIIERGEPLAQQLSAMKDQYDRCCPFRAGNINEEECWGHIRRKGSKKCLSAGHIGHTEE